MNILDTPDLGRDYCPRCEPERDPLREILRARYCEPHALEVAGIDDGKTGPAVYMSGSNEADGLDCKAMADLLRDP